VNATVFMDKLVHSGSRTDTLRMKVMWQDEEQFPSPSREVSDIAEEEHTQESCGDEPVLSGL
jgi:hypothetical protein